MSPETMTLLDQVCADLEDTSRRLRFSDSIEERFQASGRDAKVRHFVRSAIVGLIVYNVLLFSDSFLVTDILREVKLIHLVVTAVVALNIFLLHRRIVPPAMAILNLGSTFLTVLFDLHFSHSPDAIFLLFVLPFFFVYGNIALPLPFRLATKFSAFCVVMTVAVIATHPSLRLGVKILLTTFEFCLASYTLIATYRSEVFQRRSYLLTLRETLRGETLLERNKVLRSISDTDGLTGVPNRRYFDCTFEQMWKEHLQSGKSLALLIVDIDHFKRLNDEYGHLHGDLCLQLVADRLRGMMRQGEVLARYGGEEFAILLEDMSPSGAGEVGERLRAAIAAMEVPAATEEGRPHSVTVSIGCAAFGPRTAQRHAELFLAADEALYAAKHGGRNRVALHGAGPQGGTSQAASAASAAAVATMPETKLGIPC